jgi:flavin reductase (DIM6/NTAB) family NADH-FMN oxidoreductase RutF
MKRLQERISSGLYPNPVLLVSSKYKEKESIITLSWGGNVCSEPPMVAIGVRKQRYSYELISQSKEFVINIPTADMINEVNLCGTKSGKDVDKWKECSFTKGKSKEINTPFINECPINMECKLEQIIKLGTHDLFLGRVVALHLEEEWKDNMFPKMLTFTRGIYKKVCEENLEV